MLVKVAMNGYKVNGKNPESLASNNNNNCIDLFEQDLVQTFLMYKQVL